LGKLIHHPINPKEHTMRKSLSIVVIIVAGIFLSSGVLFSQDFLKEISKKQASRWKSDRAIAESIATANGMSMRVVHPNGRISEIQRYENGIPIIYATDNLTSAKTISTNKTWSGGGYGYSLNGSTDTLGEWDGGSPLTTHQEFGSRILSIEGGVADHATHVAGTMIASGVQANAHGMSNEAKLKAHDWNDDASEMAIAAAARLRVSNHSYGTITGWNYDYYGDSKWVWFGDTTVSGTTDYRFGFYDTEAETWDDIARNAPYYLICKSAGNDRGEGPYGKVVHWVFANGAKKMSNTLRDNDGGTTGYRSIGLKSLAKNILTVGAVNGISGGYQQPSNVVMSSFSCWGPTNDGRVKPDIVADGVNMYSAVTGSNSSYGYMSGTSMATPSVTGAVGILLHHQRNLHGDNPLRSSTVKGLIIHTADDAGNTGPDYKFGWGLMNTLHAVQLMTLDSADGNHCHIKEQAVAQGDTIKDTIYVDGTQPIKVTICWTDPPGTPTSKQLNPTTIMLKNDLDLRILRVSNPTTYSPYVLDMANPSVAATTGDNIRDNVEQVYIQNPTPGMYIARISHKGSITSGPQYVSVIISGNVPYHTSLVSAPPEGEFTVTPATTAQESLKVYNRGTKSLTYSMTAKNAWITPEASPASVPAGDSSFLHFTVDAHPLFQWSLYHDTLTIASNDTIHPTVQIPLAISTTGPRIFAPATVTYEADSNTVAYDSLIIYNTGTQPLTFTVTDTTASPWLTIGSVAGPVGVGESLAVQLTFNAMMLTAETHNAVLKCESNDTGTGTVYVPLSLIVYKAGTFHASVNNRWNLISLPVIPSDFRTSILYPTAASSAYRYSGTYVQQDTLANGVGYWMKFNGSQSIPLHGFIMENDSFHVTAGWNLIGALTYPVPVTMISTNTPGLTISGFYGYTAGYQIVDTLQPGRGYWVKVNISGYLNLSSLPFSILANRVVIVPIHELPPSPPVDRTPEIAIPDHFALEQAFPNPFNPSTMINYALPNPEHVTLKIYNIIGQEVFTAIDSRQEAGYKSVRIDFNNMPSGVYIYRLTAGSFTETKKMVLMK
jgi:hypothetical protein